MYPKRLSPQSLCVPSVSMLSLSQLPRDLIYELTLHLPFVDVLCLRMCCGYIKYALDKTRLLQVRYKN